MINGTCKTCRWWKRGDDEDGECRLNPPTATTYAMGCSLFFWTSQGSDWPETHKDDFCGKHQEKEKE